MFERRWRASVQWVIAFVECLSILSWCYNLYLYRTSLVLVVANPSMWIFDTLNECCDRHYKYNEAGCKGTSTSGTEKWYVVWGNPAVCVKDCEEGTGTGCGGLAMSWDTKYASQRECCSTRVSFGFRDCMAWEDWMFDIEYVTEQWKVLVHAYEFVYVVWWGYQLTWWSNMRWKRISRLYR